MSNRVFNFQTQLKVGNLGESLFLKRYKDYKKSPVLDYDFISSDGSKTELKSDMYSLTETSNFFMERYGNIETLAVGGPWRARDSGLNYFVYLFLPEKTFFWFEPFSLCNLLDPIVAKMKPKIIDNKTWQASGFAVPRELLEPVLIKKEIYNG